MIIAIAGLKGGISKTTTAIHFAGYLNQFAPTLLIDGDPNRSATKWAKQSNETGLGFKVIPESQTARFVKEATHVVIDTQARPDEESLKELLEACHLLVLPITPDFLAFDALVQTVVMLSALGSQHHKVMMSRVQPRRKDTEEIRADLIAAGVPLFQGRIREFAAYQKAAFQGVLVQQVKDANAKNAWRDYCTVAKEATDGQI